MNSRKTKPQFQVMNPHAAGIDIGSEEHYVCAPEGAEEPRIRVFGCFTSDLLEMVKWLKTCNAKSVVMESTGVYWIPAFQILESAGFEVKLVNARHVRNVPGRKTDVKDCQWLQQLHAYGLLQGSFRPPEEICKLRTYIRQRDLLIQSAASHINRMQKALTQMNVQLHKVLSDISGATGMRILKAILNGERDPHLLAALREAKVKRDAQTIAKALDGDYREELLFCLRQEMDFYEMYQVKIKECDKALEENLKKMEVLKEVKIASRPPKKKGYMPAFDLAGHWHGIAGVDLTQIDGLGALTVQTILSEVGLDMSKWPTEKHFASWLGLCPNNRITGGKIHGTRSRKVVHRAATAFRLAANSVGRANCALGAYFRRLKARMGTPKAITATAHKIARIFYRCLKERKEYRDLGADYYEQKYRERVLKTCKRGLRLSDTPFPQPRDSSVS